MGLLDGLDEAQLTAVTNPTDPVCVLARAGAGKTRVLTRRIAWRADRGDLDIRRVLAITFTTRAARELTGRLADLVGRDTGTTGTFHAIAWRMIRDHHAQRGADPPTLLENPRGLLADIVGEARRDVLGGLSGEISWAAARGISPDGYTDAVRSTSRPTPLAPERIAGILADYATEKRRRKVVDFDDLISRCVELLRDDEAFARAQRWRYRHIFVDEYQDVNPLQQRLLDAWLGGREDLFVVGDPNQAIYGFNGADARFLTGFGARHPDATVIELTTNHRSTPALVRIADSVLSRRSVDPGSVPVETAPTITACADEQAEALTIARRLRAGHRPGHRWGSQAVLVRTHAQGVPITDTLTRAGIPVADRTDQGPRDAVRILSFHAAKGLEWPTVHVAGLEEGFVPDIHARDPAALAEEQRLLYVAMSRATRQVHLTWARQRSFSGRRVQRTPSRWLPPMTATIDTGPPAFSATTDRPSEPRWEDPEPDQTAKTRLLRWRASTAHAAAVPDSVVIEDAVLDELVRSEPADLDALRHVPGLGTIKANQYGPALLEALRPERTR